MEAVVEAAIERHVNGGIRHLTKTVEDAKNRLDDYIEEDTRWKGEDAKWKADAQEYREKKLEPIVDSRRNWDWAGTKLKAGAILITLIGSAIVMLIKFSPYK